MTIDTKRLRRIGHAVGISLLHESGEIIKSAADEIDALREERDKLCEALQGLDEAYCRAGTGLSKEERHEDRLRLIAARAAMQGDGHE